MNKQDIIKIFQNSVLVDLISRHFDDYGVLSNDDFILILRSVENKTHNLIRELNQELSEVKKWLFQTRKV